MKKFFYLLILASLAIFFIACESDNNDSWIPELDEPIVHTHFTNATNNAVHQFNYSFDNLKSTVGDTAIQFIRFTSYYSRDDGQRNIHEIEVYVADTNFLYKNDSITFTSNRSSAPNEQPENVADGDYTYDGRWAGFRLGNDGDADHDSINRFSHIMNTLLTSIEQDTTITEIERINAFDSIVNNTVYPDFDTVEFHVDLNRVVNINSLKLFLGPYTQVFDIEVSADGQNWTLLKPEDVLIIYENR